VDEYAYYSTFDQFNDEVSKNSNLLLQTIQVKMMKKKIKEISDDRFQYVEVEIEMR